VWGSGGIALPFLTAAIGGGEWSASCLCSFILGETAPGVHCIGGWVGPRAGLDVVEKRIFSCPCPTPRPPSPQPSGYTDWAIPVRCKSTNVLEDIARPFLLPATRWFLVSLILQPWRWRRHVSVKYRVTFNGLHGPVSQTIELLYTILMPVLYIDGQLLEAK
jgi:hypothetical protein